MSEYQCYQWKKVGRSLSSKQRKEVSNLSSHISVTADSAEVTYHWGDFKHDPKVVLEQYFDIFLYEVNWGTQRVAFRFDLDTVDRDLLASFTVGDSIEVNQIGDSLFVDVWFEENWVEPSYTYYDQYEDMEDWRLEAFESIYCQIQQGDYRGLFLLWLKGCELSPEEEKKVGLPKGMAKMDEAHHILADFIGVDGRLIRQAAERSQPLHRKRKIEKSLDLYVPKLSADRRDDYVKSLVFEDAYSVQSALRSELKKLGNRRPLNHLGKSIRFEELADAAKKEAESEARRAKEEKEKRRKEYLEELGKREDELLDCVHKLVSEKKTKFYEEPILLLRGLEDLWVSRGDRDHFLVVVACIANEFPRLTGFRGRLEDAAWLTPKKEDLYLEYRQERFQKENPLESEINFNLL